MSEESYHSTPPLSLWLFIHDILRLFFSFIPIFNRTCLDARSIIVLNNAIVYLFCHVVIEGWFSSRILYFLFSASSSYSSKHICFDAHHLISITTIYSLLFLFLLIDSKQKDKPVFYYWKCLDFKCNFDWKKIIINVNVLKELFSIDKVLLLLTWPWKYTNTICLFDQRKKKERNKISITFRQNGNDL
jgi:hypothetical protein